MAEPVYDLIIDPELRDHLEAPSSVQDGMLETDLVRCGGPMEPITVWRGKKIIVDGHRRYGICQRKKLPYRVREMDFPDVQAVKDWMDILQGSRRNQSPHAQAMLLARRAEAMRRNRSDLSVQSSIEMVARDSGTSDRTVFRAMSYSKAIKSLPADIQALIESRALRGQQADVIALAEFDEDRVRAIVRSVMDGEFKTLRHALRGDMDDSEQRDDIPPREDDLAEPEEFEGEFDDAYEEEENLDSEPEETDDDEELPPEPVEEEDDDLPPTRTDKVSVEPTRRPVIQVLNEADKHLGKLVRLMDEIKRACPARHKGVMTLARQISELIEEWQDEEK
jgi:hypothetical protein